MKEFSNNNEILEFAIDREIRANRFYLSLAERMADPKMQQLLLALAADEIDHKERLEFELIKRGQPVATDSTIEEDEEEIPMIGSPGGLVMDYKAAMEMVIQKVSPVLYQSLGIFLPLITTNCAVLGLAVLNIQKDYTFLEGVVFAIGAALGFTLALVLFAGLRERLELSVVPQSFRGTAIALVTAGLLSLAFMGFAGLVKG